MNTNFIGFDTTGFDMPDLYKIKRIITVNSSQAHYVELSIEETAALIASNNEGKTSTLNAIKLFMLPEVNFKKSEAKFNFTSKGKAHSGIESFNYYFPMSSSFIILEATNPKGDFCIVLYQHPTEELGYGRIAVDCDYESIKHLFWDEELDKNDGKGGQPDNLNLAEVKSYLLRQMKGRSLDTTEEIRNALYTRYNDTKPETRFCLMPLVQKPSTQLMRSIKSLLQLSFDIKGADEQNLPMAIANIIDCDISTSSTPINIDFKAIDSNKEALKKEIFHISRLKANLREWAELEGAYSTYKEKKWELIKQRANIKAAIGVIKNTYEPKAAKINAALNSSKIELAEKNKERGLISQEINSCNTLIKNAKNNIATLEARIKIASDAIASNSIVVGSSDVDSIVGYLENEQKGISSLYESTQNAESASARLKQSLQDEKRYEEEYLRLDKQIKNNVPSVLSVLSPPAANLINSINPNFRAINASPSEDEVGVIESFAALFSEVDGVVHFLGRELGRTPLAAFDERSALDELRQKRNESKAALDKEIVLQNKLNETLEKYAKNEGESLSDDLNEIKKQLNEIDVEINAVKKYSYDIEALDENQANIASINTKLEEFKESAKVINAQREELESVLEKLSEESVGIKEATEKGAAAQSKINGIDIVASELFRDDSGYSSALLEDQDVVALSIEELGESLEEVDALLKDYTDSREIALEKFKKIISAGIVQVDTDLLYSVKGALEDPGYSIAYEKMRSEFANIGYKEKDIQAKIKNHNHSTSTEVGKLDAMATAIKNFERKLNDKLEKIKISNLSKVSIAIKTVDGFTTLRKELASHGYTTNTLMADSFYNRLSSFCDKYITESSGKLDLEQIINEIEFQYHVNGKVVTTSQSNGTGSMINAVLLTILLKSLVPDDVVFTLPIIFDEVGSLDEKNLIELRKVVEDSNLILLVANPYNNGYISKYINRIYNLGLSKANEGVENLRTIFISSDDRDELTVIAEANTEPSEGGWGGSDTNHQHEEVNTPEQDLNDKGVGYGG